MASRRVFLGTALAGGAGMMLSAGAQAQTTPQPAPTATPLPAPPSATSLAMARKMRTYDPKLTDADIANIASQIDANAKASKRLNPRGRRLKNSDEPATAFAVKS